MVLLVAMLIALVWTVHLHREQMRLAPDTEELMSAVSTPDASS